MLIRKHVPEYLLLIILLLVISTAVSAVEITKGAMLSNSCAACHGTAGKSPGSIPSINDKPAQFLIQSLKDFRSGKRPSTVMGRHASGYNDEEIKHIANYFSSQK